MGLFFDVLSAINNPNQQASVSQLESIMSSVQQVATNSGVQPSTMQSILSTLGGFMGPALRQQQGMMGGSQLENLLGRLGGAGAAASLPSLFPPQLQQQMAQEISQRTGLSANAAQGMLPTLIPTVLSLLNMGATKPGVTTAGASSTNPLLTAFLDGDRDGDADLGDVFKFAGRFLSPPTA